MGAKKKVEPQPAPPPPPEKNTNSILRVVTSEGKEFKINEEVFVRYSSKAKILSDSSKDGTIKLEEVDAECFEVIAAFL